MHLALRLLVICLACMALIGSLFFLVESTGKRLAARSYPRWIRMIASVSLSATCVIGIAYGARCLASISLSMLPR